MFRILSFIILLLNLDLSSEQCKGCENLGELAGKLSSPIRYFVRKPKDNEKLLKVLLLPEDNEDYKSIEISKDGEKIIQKIEPISTLKGINKNKLPLLRLMKKKVMNSLGSDSMEEIIKELIK